MSFVLPFEIQTEAADQLRCLIYEAKGTLVTSSMFAGRPVTVVITFGEDPGRRIASVERASARPASR